MLPLDAGREREKGLRGAPLPLTDPVPGPNGFRGEETKEVVLALGDDDDA